MLRSEIRQGGRCLTKDREALLAFYDFPADIGSICGGRTRSRARSPPFDTAQSDRRVASRTRPRSPWCSSSRGRGEKLALPRRPRAIAKVIIGVKFDDGIEVVARSAAPQAKAA